jgi:prepilin-type N-terminal cleavage/methylation domain-containing protein
MKHKKTGFTLIEVLLSIALITVLAGVAVPTYYSLFYKNDLDVAKNQVAQSLRRAEVLSSASDGDATWGLKIQSGSVIIFKGLNYTDRDIKYDEAYQISSSIVPSGLLEIVFNKMTGFPQLTGNIVLTSINGETRTITINAKGQIAY